MGLSADLSNTRSITLEVNGGTVGPTVGVGPQGPPGPGSAAWTALEAVTAATVRQAPDGSYIRATTSRTTRATFDATEQGFWAPVLATAGTLENTALLASIDTRVGPTRININTHATTMTRAGIQAVIDAAPAGAEFYLARQGSGDGSITLDTTPLVPSAAGQKFVHDRALVINQPNLYVPVYDILDRDDITIHDLTAVGPSTRPVSGVGFRGSSLANYQAAVWTNSHRTRITGLLRSTNFKIGANFTAWDTLAGAYVTKAHKDCLLEDGLIVGADFGTLIYGQVGLRIGRITGRDFIDSSALTDPNHVIYLAGRDAGSGDIRNENIQIGQVIGDNNNFGHAVSAKYTDGLQIGQILATRHGVLFVVIDCTDWNVDDMQLSHTITDIGNVLVPLSGQTPLAKNGTIGNCRIDDTVGDNITVNGVNAVNFAADGYEIGRLEVITNRAGAAGGTDVLISGSKGEIGHLRTEARGASKRSCQMGKDSLAGTDLTVRSHETWNALGTVVFNLGTTGAAYNYNSALHRSPAFTGNGVTTGGAVGGAPVYTVKELGLKSPKITNYTATGTWTPDPLAKRAILRLVGGGAGGAAGATAATGVAAAGGPGGGGGARSEVEYNIADIPVGPITVTVGAAGAGGAGISANSTAPSGAALGTAGGTTSVSGLARAGGGQPPSTATAGGQGGSGATSGTAGGASSATGAAGTGGAAGTISGAGGGGGGGLTTGNVTSAGGAGAFPTGLAGVATSSGGTAGSGSGGGSASAATTPIPSSTAVGGFGGGGGGSDIAGNGGNGGAGAGYGGGGGGGGAARNGNTSGSGGAGTAGYVQIEEFY